MTKFKNDHILNNVWEIYSCDTNKDITLQAPSYSEKYYGDLQWCHKLPSDKADVHQFVEEQNGLNKTTAPKYF
jgi:hypothetical protein